MDDNILKNTIQFQQVDTICFGGEDWWYHNRGHIDMQLTRRFSKLGTAVYVNSIVMQKPGLAQAGKFLQKLKRKAKSIFTGLKKSDAGFWVFSPFSMPVHHIPLARGFNSLLLRCQIHRITKKLSINNPLVWVACPAACDIAVNMKKSKMVYQRTDRFEEYPNVDAGVISEYDRKLKQAADLTVFVNRVLFEQEKKQCKRAFFLDHGVDYEMFAQAQGNIDKPDDIARVKQPIVGFFGGIDDHTSDIAFLEKVIGLLPEMSFVFVGKASSDCSGLKSHSNVIMLGQKPYQEIPRYGRAFNVAIMPWRQNRWIEACNPIKLKEYLALGKPVVSTPFPQLQEYKDVVYEARTPDEFSEKIKQSIAEDCPPLIAARREKVRNQTWDSKAQLVLNELFNNSNKS
jgi:glycosyltransferase involved in cell wall biosynthesis